ncbi:DoxX family protein [Streptantibioticus silvisoli]|uniref:DoxX family protein n=1 Tax=Streptantibioticus silvisoli TaxID=2705255 RepID=A0ABT6W157_9ACTN|nr:DoxX family protein [Streptantibioticus silvisoli]MDI5963677.1 DoxX family protein [Streptantibioticus silvisoli]
MSVDTRTPRSPSGGRTPGFDEDVLNTVRVLSDPAQVIVNHASFRVRLGGSAPPPRFGVDDVTVMPVLPTSVRSGAEARTRRRRAAPVVWSGHSRPGDPGATQLLQAVRGAGATQLLPRVTEKLLAEEIDDGMPPVRPAVVAPRSPVLGGAPPAEPFSLPRPARGVPADVPAPAAYDPFDDTQDGTYDIGPGRDGRFDDGRDGYGRGSDRVRRERRRSDPVRHAWYPGRRMNLGVVLLPLRVFLGFICVYAGLGKLCDPVYFDGGQRGSMVHWLAALHPWSVAEPLRSAALSHPVGAGLTVAFLQVVVGVLTVMGLWQRIAAVLGALLSVALLVTVSWRTAPVYDAPDIIYLAAWSPLVIAGAPVYSIDSKLAGEAWRRLGPRAPLWQLRRYVVRRGVVVATFVAGGALVIGALFGSAVRASSSHVESPAAPTDLPTNSLPGSPYPQAPGTGPSASQDPLTRGLPRGAKSATPGASSSAKPSAPPASAAPGVRHTGGLPGSRAVPTQQQTVQAPRPQAPPVHTVPPAPEPSTGGSSSSGSTGSTGSLGGLLGIKPSSGYLLGMRGDDHRPAGSRAPGGAA